MDVNRSELAAQVALGMDAQAFLAGDLCREVILAPLEAAKSSLGELEAKDASTFVSLAIQRDTLKSVLTALGSIIASGEEAGKILSGDPSGEPGRIC